MAEEQHWHKDPCALALVVEIEHKGQTVEEARSALEEAKRQREVDFGEAIVAEK